jgi:outer membrane immunogenic protein
MRIWTQYAFVLSLAVFAVSTTHARAQEAKAPNKPPRAELGIDYTYVRSNAPPGGCTCINLNGGNAMLAIPIKGGPFAAVGDWNITHGSAIGSGGYTLTMSTITGGLRYAPRFGHQSLRPFAEVLAGLAHASGTLTQGGNPAGANASATFAGIAGGGLDLRANHRFLFRLIEADYLVTTFDNGANNHQNNIRIGTGVVVRF